MACVQAHAARNTDGESHVGIRAWIYDRALLPLTTGWYRAVLDRLPEGASLLDVGIGTAGALVGNAALVKERNLRVVGVDIDADYVKQAQKHVADAGLEDRVRVDLKSIYDFDEKGFDAAYFSASFMLMPDPEAALRHVMGLLAPGGRIFFTQTFQEKRSPLTERFKPMLKTLTTVDFGQVTYEADFLAVLEKGGLTVLEHERLGGRPAWSYRLVVGKPAA